jgi:nitrate reductase gamma subunit
LDYTSGLCSYSRNRGIDGWKYYWSDVSIIRWLGEASRCRVLVSFCFLCIRFHFGVILVFSYHLLILIKSGSRIQRWVLSNVHMDSIHMVIDQRLGLNSIIILNSRRALSNANPRQEIPSKP